MVSPARYPDYPETGEVAREGCLATSVRGSQEVALAPYLASPVPLTLSPEAGADIGSHGSAGARVTSGKSGVSLGKTVEKLQELSRKICPREVPREIRLSQEAQPRGKV